MAIAAPEAAILAAHELGVAAGFAVSPTGTAGLAGLLAPDGAAAPGANVAVVFSGLHR